MSMDDQVQIRLSASLKKRMKRLADDKVLSLASWIRMNLEEITRKKERELKRQPLP